MRADNLALLTPAELESRVGGLCRLADQLEATFGETVAELIDHRAAAQDVTAEIAEQLLPL